MIELNENFIDGQITCPECGEIFFDRGQINGRLRWIPSHGDCNGAGARAPLKQLKNSKAINKCDEYHLFVKLVNVNRG